jgi:hypothetical protein
MGNRVAGMLLSMMALAPAIAQDAPATTVDIGRCMDIKDRSDRIRCYDALADEVRARSRPQGAPTTGSAGTDKLSTFGKESPARVVDTKDGGEELHDRVESLRTSPAGNWILTLESGQVWQQSIPGSYNLRKGHEVRIYPSKWGNTYRLSAKELNGFIQVQRIK